MKRSRMESAPEQKGDTMNFEQKAELLAQYIGVVADAIEEEAPSHSSNFELGALRTSEGTYFVMDEAETKTAFTRSMEEYVEDFGVECLIKKYGTDSIETAFEVAKETGKLGVEISCDDENTYQFDDMYIFKNSSEDERSAEFLKDMLQKDGGVLKSRENSDYGEHEFEIQHIENPEHYLDCFVVKEDGEYWQKQDREGNDTGFVEILNEEDVEFLLLEERLEGRYGTELDRVVEDLSAVSEIPFEELLHSAKQQGYDMADEDILKIIRDSEKPYEYDDD